MPTRGYATTPYGQMHYAETGEGPAILLLHQTPRSHDEFREVQPMLAGGHRVIAMDMYGFGLSASLPAPQTIEAMAAGAYALLDALGIERATLMGHHTGAAVAIEMAAAAPSRVRELILSSPPWTGPEYRQSHADGPSVDVAETAEDGSHLTELWSQRRPYFPAGRPDLLDRFIHDALAPGVDPAEGHRACARYVMEDRIGKVEALTLIIGASDDPFALPNVEVVRAHLTAAARVEVAVIAGGRIPLMEEKASEVAALVTAFVTAPGR
ncbi:alpha/beta hydrolase [Actinoplanes sp. OR16]|uniref:alpha/beta fold hydrolase n=1 Tax=Actinoplanes sp. OR16 TaxID=946334 RepID=UPI000F6C5A9E|nr:alpha/beta fold hydrolase [Actinoplanes sp. OR16]BBH67907.1 alpha/beta hydrolase [Actinoplanes sp. OR16]